MNLLLVTDHRFLEHRFRIYDTATFDCGFFRDYQEAFEEISVLCRLSRINNLPPQAVSSDGRGIRFIALPDIHGLLWALIGDQLAAPKAGQAVKEADALVIRVPGQAGWAAGRLARKLDKPYLVEVVGDPREAVMNLGHSFFHRLIAFEYARRLRSLAWHATSASYVTSVHLPARYPVKHGSSFHCLSDIRLGTDQIAEPRNYSRTGGCPLKVIMVAKLVPYKRHQDLLQALKKAIRRGTKVEAHVVGDGPCRQPLESLCHRLELSPQVRFHGHISDRRALLDLLDASDLFILTSGTEGLPRAVIEALARGLPVIASRAGGTPELVNESELFPVGDVEALAGLIVSLADDAGRLTRLSALNIEKAKEFSAEKLSSQRVGLYRFLRERAEQALSPPGGSGK